jgi:hypothetical protein
MKIHIRTTNAAFHDEAGEPDPAPELARILRKIANRIEAEGQQTDRGERWTVLDSNGNTVGTVSR